MGVLKTIGYFLLGLSPLAIILIVFTLMRPPLAGHAYMPTNTLLVTNEPAGLVYEGPPTTALASYYCVYQAQVVSNGWLINGVYVPIGIQMGSLRLANLILKPGNLTGYSIQLNAVAGGYWLQDVYVYVRVSGRGVLKTLVNVWRVNGSLVAYAWGPVARPCGWLVVRIVNGTVWFGYSGDGVGVDWYYSYPLGNTTIRPGLMTNLVIGGPGGGRGVGFMRAYIVLALYYWNGTSWVPAPVTPTGAGEWYMYGTAEFVNRAWVYVSGNGGVVSWPSPINQVVYVPPPQFRP